MHLGSLDRKTEASMYPIPIQREGISTLTAIFRTIQRMQRLRSSLQAAVSYRRAGLRLPQAKQTCRQRAILRTSISRLWASGLAQAKKMKKATSFTQRMTGYCLLLSLPTPEISTWKLWAEALRDRRCPAM